MVTVMKPFEKLKLAAGEAPARAKDRANASLNASPAADFNFSKGLITVSPGSHPPLQFTVLNQFDRRSPGGRRRAPARESSHAQGGEIQIRDLKCRKCLLAEI